MGKISRSIAGHRAKNHGLMFEKLIMMKCAVERITCKRIPSGCEWRRTPNGVRAVPVKTPFDFILSKSGKCVFIDAKHTDGETFVYSKIEEHQKRDLMVFELAGNNAGYVVEFGNRGVVFFKASVLFTIHKNQSLKPEDGIALGEGNNFILERLFQL